MILQGADGFFSSGLDLRLAANMLDTCGGEYVSTLMHDNLRRLERLPMVSIALVEGKAVGGGAEVAVGCDLRVFNPSARIGFVQARLALTSGFGGGMRLARMIGQPKALQLMLSAKTIDVPKAQSLGLVQYCLPEGTTNGPQALQRTIEWYRTNFGTITVHASRQVKSIIAESAKNQPLDQALDFEAKMFHSAWGSKEHKAALDSNIKHK